MMDRRPPKKPQSNQVIITEQLPRAVKKYLHAVACQKAG